MPNDLKTLLLLICIDLHERHETLGANVQHMSCSYILKRNCFNTVRHKHTQSWWPCIAPLLKLENIKKMIGV